MMTQAQRRKPKTAISPGFQGPATLLDAPIFSPFEDHLELPVNNLLGQTLAQSDPIDSDQSSIDRLDPPISWILQNAPSNTQLRK